MKVVLDSKTILAHSLTYEQAANLTEAIRTRKDLESLLNNRDIWMSNTKPRFEGDETIWYVYLIDSSLRTAFLANPQDFVFEI